MFRLQSAPRRTRRVSAAERDEEDCEELKRKLEQLAREAPGVLVEASGRRPSLAVLQQQLADVRAYQRELARR